MDGNNVTKTRDCSDDIPESTKLGIERENVEACNDGENVLSKIKNHSSFFSNSEESSSASIYNTALETNSLSSDDKNGKILSIVNNIPNESSVSSPRSSLYESALTNLSNAESDSTTPFRSINSSFDSSTLYHSVNSHEFSAHSSASLTSDADSEIVDVGEDITITDDPECKEKLDPHASSVCKSQSVGEKELSALDVDDQASAIDEEKSALRRTSLISDISSEGAVTDNLTDDDDDEEDDELTELLEKKSLYKSAKSNANILDTSDDSPKETNPFLWDKPCSPFEIICMDDLDGYEEYVCQQDMQSTGVAGLKKEDELFFGESKEKGLSVIKEESFEVDDSDDICSVKYVEQSKSSSKTTLPKRTSYVENIISHKLPLDLSINSRVDDKDSNVSKINVGDFDDVFNNTNEANMSIDPHSSDFSRGKDSSTTNFQSQTLTSPIGALQPSELFSQELIHLSDSSAITADDLFEELQGIHCGQVDPMVTSSHTLYDIETPSDETPEPNHLLPNRNLVANQKTKPVDDIDDASIKSMHDFKITRSRNSSKIEASDHEASEDSKNGALRIGKKNSAEHDFSDERPFLTNQGSVEPELQMLFDPEVDCDSNRIFESQPASVVYPRPHSDSSADLHPDAELRASSRPESVPCNTYHGTSLLVLASQDNESLDRPISPVPDDAFRITSEISFLENKSEKIDEKQQKGDAQTKNLCKVISHTEILSKDLKDEINFGTMKTDISLPIHIPKSEHNQDFDDMASVSSRGSLAEFERIESAIDMAEGSVNLKDSILSMEEDRIRKSSSSSLVIGSLSSLQEFERLEKEIISESMSSLESKYDKVYNEFDKDLVTEMQKDTLASINQSAGGTSESVSKPNLQESLLPLRYKDKIQAVPEMSPISEPDVSMEQDSLSSPDTERRKPLEQVEEEEEMSIDCQMSESRMADDIYLDIEQKNLRNNMISSKTRQNDTMFISADSLQEENRMTESVDSLSASIQDNIMTASVDSLERINKEAVNLHEINVNDAMITSADSLEGVGIQQQPMMADSLDGSLAVKIIKQEDQDLMLQSVDSLELNENEDIEKVEDEIEIDSLQGSYIDHKSLNHPLSLQGSLSDSRCFDSLQDSFTNDKKHLSFHNSLSEKLTRDSLERSLNDEVLARADFSADSLMSSNKNQTNEQDSLNEDISRDHSGSRNSSKCKIDANVNELESLELDNGSGAGLRDKSMNNHGKVKHFELERNHEG